MAARFVFVMAFTGPHADEALNVLLSLRKAGVVGPSVQNTEIIIYSALDAHVEATLRSVSPAVIIRPLTIPSVRVESMEADHATRAFSQIVQGKFIALEDAIEGHPGAHIVWLDTDIYFFRDPRPMLLAHAARAAGMHAHFQRSTSNACTGFFMITPDKHTEGLNLLRRAKTILLAHLAKGPGAGYRGDESCINEVISKGRVPVSFFPRELFPNGQDYFTKGMRARAVLVHNNFIRGLDQKVARFKLHGLWLVGAGPRRAAAGARNLAAPLRSLPIFHPAKRAAAPRRAAVSLSVLRAVLGRGGRWHRRG